MSDNWTKVIYYKKVQFVYLNFSVVSFWKFKLIEWVYLEIIIKTKLDDYLIFYYFMLSYMYTHCKSLSEELC